MVQETHQKKQLLGRDTEKSTKGNDAGDKSAASAHACRVFGLQQVSSIILRPVLRQKYSTTDRCAG